MPVYMVRAGEHGPVKIGFSDNVALRLVKMQADNHERLTILRIFAGGPTEEALFHERFADQHLHGEWHSFTKAMLGDLGLVELPNVFGKAGQIFNRMNELIDRLGEVGEEQLLSELTEGDHVMLHTMRAKLNTPLWEHVGLPDPNKRHS